MIRRFLYCFILLLIVTAPAAAQTISELNARRKKAENEIAYIDKLLKKNTKDKKNTLQQLALTQKKIKSRKQIIADMDAQIHLLEADMGRKQQNVVSLQHNLDTLQKSYEQLLYQAYKNRDERLWQMFILSSDNLGLAYRRWQYFKSYSNYINEQAQRIQQTSNKLSTEIVSLSTKKEQLAAQKKAREVEIGKLQKEEAEAQQLSKNLASQEKDLARKMAEQRKAIEKINKQIENIIAEQAKKDKKTQKEKPNLSVIDQALSAKFQDNRGRLPWPVSKGVVVGKFGKHFDPVFKNIELPPNNGIDISTDDNSAVFCVFEGVVKQVIMLPGMNNCVLMQHGEYYTLYCKLSTLNVKVGDKLKTGDRVGTVFTTDTAVLHFEIWKATGGSPEKMNPELWLK